MRAFRYVLLLFAVMIVGQSLDLRAQYRRRDIGSFTGPERKELRDLMMTFITNTIINQHATNTGTIHCENTVFLNWHRDYVAQLEAFLMTQPNGTKYVPLPKWDPSAIGIPNEFFNSLVLPGSAVASGWPNLVNQNITSFGNFNFTPFTTPSVCGAYPAGIPAVVPVRACTGGLNSYGTALDNFALALERQHNWVHNDVGGVMADAQHSPAAAIFWLWHAYVDDHYRYYECNCMGAPAKDLYMKDNAADVGKEPNTTVTNGVYWDSPDIWVRQNQDPFAGGKYQHEDDINRHENPEYKALGGSNYVYVRIRNLGCVPVGATDVKLHVYWSKWSPGVWQWQANWITPPQGSEITPAAGVSVPVINTNGQWVAEIPWSVPNPAIYPTDPHHFCLLARLVSTVDPMHTTEGLDVFVNTKENNNVAWRNVQVYDNNPFNIVGPGQGGFATFNMRATRANFLAATLRFDFDPNPAIHAAVDLGPELHQLWVEGGRRGEGITELENNQVRIDRPGASIEGLHLNPDVTYNPSVQVYATLKAGGGAIDVRPGDINKFHVIQYETDNGGEETITGGITVELRNAQTDDTKEQQIATVEIAHPTCPSSSDGSITLTPVNPESDGLTYWWSNGAATKDIANIAPGTYTVVVYNPGTGKSEQRDIEVTSASSFAVTVDATNSTCGLANGRATAASTGGTPPYAYQWYDAAGNAIQGATSRELTNIAHGYYIVEASDAAGCRLSQAIWVDEDMSMLAVYLTKGDASSQRASDGWAQANVEGMMSPFTYQWSNGKTSEKISNLSPGTYSVTVTDAMGCTKMASIDVGVQPPPPLQGVDPDMLSGAQILAIAPNPTSREAEVTYILQHEGNVRIEIFDESGKLVRFVEDGPKYSGENRTRIDTRSITSGRYALRITFDGHVSSMPFVVVR